MQTQMINFKLPTIDINEVKKKTILTKDDEDTILGILHNPKDGKGLLRATRPKASGKQSYLWRKLMILVSPEEKFHTIATSIDEYIEDGDDRNEVMEHLSKLASIILCTIPIDYHVGSNIWKEALGN